MKLVVGLGNPGRKYEATRHNMGFMVIDRLAQAYEITCLQKNMMPFVAEEGWGQKPLSSPNHSRS